MFAVAGVLFATAKMVDIVDVHAVVLLISLNSMYPNALCYFFYLMKEMLEYGLTMFPPQIRESSLGC